jgi:hypothetical protein
MELYTKNINGQNCVLPANKIVIIKRGMQIFNPTKKMLLKDGWMEYLPQTIELSDEEKLQDEQKHLIDDLLLYDSSENVNMFYVNNIPMWLDKATRSGLLLRFQSEKAVGKTETTLWYGDYEFSLPLETAIYMLYSIEVYASACYDTTQKHIHTINEINTLDDLKSYDFTVGYPEKLVFNI